MFTLLSRGGRGQEGVTQVPSSRGCLGLLLPGEVSLQLGEGGQPLVPPDSPLPEALQGDSAAHGGLQGGHLRLVSLCLLSRKVPSSQ